MKIWKLALAALLAAGTVAAYIYFPNPVEAAARGEPAATAQEPAPAESTHAELPAGGGEST